ncbi:hypothetical protein M3O96_04935 [Aquiflexum sp. TKW24L]|uniref:hypothetical protein n=1 Tax=Aquiflexum sp. TKW24L TaxID=2942212 RepID=UPI0020C10044|nr:hypothetical protein [Aquiflexum sp. TKW24L]MCL6258421.1 hypothetical protein [Aquiflexum sp. TKW24L]
MKRIHLFEFEDMPWFPDWIRVLMTRYIMTFHRVLDTPGILEELVEKGLQRSEATRIIDLCSGSGGPMLEVAEKLKTSGKFPDLKLMLSDLYPDQEAARSLNQKGDESVTYLIDSLDATQVRKGLVGLRTMVSSMHHMKPEVAKKILNNAKVAHQPILIFEISDNTPPIFLWWLAIPFAFIMTFFVTPIVRPISWQQLVFTYLIPILPFFIAWDGAVSNARTYTLDDMEELIRGLSDGDYGWEMGKVKGKGGKKLYLLGSPKHFL